MEKRTGSLKFGAVTVILVIVTAFCCAGTVMSREDLSREEQERYYLEREGQLVKDVREYLGQKGYEDSGVMLTRVVDMDGSREYTLSIHHHRITGLSGEEQEQLAGSLREMAFSDQCCVVFIDL